MTEVAPQLILARTTLAFAALAALLLWEAWRPFFPFFANGRERARHVFRNLIIGLLNGGIAALFSAYLWSLAATWSSRNGFGLLHRIELPGVTHAVLAILLLDIWTYWWHRVNHRFKWLWRFHRMHHSDPSMDVTSARRFHPGEIALSSILRVPLIALLGIHIHEIVIYEMLMGLCVDFHHANIAIPEPVDRVLRSLIVTPAMHKVHHSRLQPETDTNYTSLLSVWDRLFKSFCLRKDLAAIRIGLDDWSEPQHQTLGGMLSTPFSRVAVAKD